MEKKQFRHDKSNRTIIFTNQIIWFCHWTTGSSFFTSKSVLFVNFINWLVLNNSVTARFLIQLFFLKNRHDFIGSKHTPGCAFLFFLQENDVATCYAWERWPQRKGVCLALWSRKNYALFVNSTGLLLLLCLFFFCAFCCFTCFVWYKSSVVFFACCCLWQFWLCLFVRFGAFPAPISPSCLSLLLAIIILWVLPFCPVFFLFYFNFFHGNKRCLLLLQFCCCVSCCVSRSCC